MKQILLSLIIVFTLDACYNEDPIVAERPQSKYDLTDDPADPVQHYIYEFYQKYKTIIIKKPQESDYKFNFNAKNRIRIVPPEQDQTILRHGLKFMENVFLDIYNTAFKEKYLPVNIILADSIFDAGFGSDAYNNSVSSVNFIAIGNIREGIENLSQEAMKTFLVEINGKFWTDYMIRAKGFFEVSNAFYEVSSKDYGKVVINYDEGKKPEDIDFHEMGFITYDEEASMVDPEDPAWNRVQNPRKELDLNQWLNFIFEKTPDEIKAINDKYPKMKKKYEILREGMMQCEGFDISKIKH